MHIILNDQHFRHQFLPLSFTRSCYDLRTGILTFKERWERFLGVETVILTESYLQSKYKDTTHSGVFIQALFLPTVSVVKAIEALAQGQALYIADELIAFRGSIAEGNGLNQFEKVSAPEPLTLFKTPESLFLNNALALEFDFELLTKGRKSQPIGASNTVLGDKVFFEEGAEAECAVLNSLTGAIYVGRGASIMEGSLIRGGLALCEGAQLKLGSKIYGYTTIGPYCKVGGEVNNSILTGYSSKAHDGFLGNAIIGEWCNLGADTNNSNLKNNYAEVKLWDYTSQRFRATGQQFLGLVMADHAKCGINTMFNTGTVVGVAANVFGAGFPRNFVPDFAWGGAQGFEVYQLPKVVEVAEKVMARRNIILSDQDKAILTEVFNQTEVFRTSFSK